MTAGTRCDCVVIGSGRSLLQLSGEEKIFLNAHPRTLALNKYLLFYEKIGVAPKDLFLADCHYPAHKVFLETIAKARLLDPMPAYYVSRNFEKFFVRPLRNPLWNFTERRKLWKDFQTRLPWKAEYPRLAFFPPIDVMKPDGEWAENLDEQLYFMRSSLTSAINLAYIIYPGADIKLLGVDLKTVEPFYDEEFQLRPDLIDKYYWIGKKEGKHYTAMNKWGGTVMDGVARARDELRARGIGLSCCHPSSVLVEDKVLEYSPLLAG